MVRLRGSAVVVVVAVLAVLALTGNALASNWTPTIPSDAATTVLATTVLNGDIPADVIGDFDGQALPRSPAGVGCPDQIVRPIGTFYLCWEAYRDPNDGDLQQDYYHLRVHGSFGADPGSGLRWAVLRARLVGQPSNQVFMTWPDHTYDGPCRKVDALIMSPGHQTETVCGRTTGSLDAATWTQTATWVCVGCLIPDHDYRAIAIDEFIAVPEGTVPTWQIFADIGA